MKWLKSLFARIGDLILKLIAVKVVAASVCTAIFLSVVAKTGDGIVALVGFVIVAAMWALVVGTRYAEKVVDLARQMREAPPVAKEKEPEKLEDA